MGGVGRQAATDPNCQNRATIWTANAQTLQVLSENPLKFVVSWKFYFLGASVRSVPVRLYSGGLGALIVSGCGVGVPTLVWLGVNRCSFTAFGRGASARIMG